MPPSLTTSAAVPAATHLPPPRSVRTVGTCVHDGRSWAWDEDAARLHGLAPGADGPVETVLLAHCHAEDRPDLAALLARAEPRAVRYRVTGAAGDERPVLAVVSGAARAPGSGPSAVLLIDLTTDVIDLATARADAMLAEAVASRELIDEAKGAVMLAYGLNGTEAFELLRWHSEHLNLKVRALADRLVGSLTSRRRGGAEPRDLVDTALARTADLEGAVTTRTSATAPPTVTALHVTHTCEDGEVVARVEGEVDAATTPILVSGLHNALRATSSGGTLVVDLTAVRRLGPLAALHLGRLRRRCERADVGLRLLPPVPRGGPSAPPGPSVPPVPAGAAGPGRALLVGPTENVVSQHQPTRRNAR